MDLSAKQILLSALNKRGVLEILYEQGPINKAAIARITELSLPTVMKLTDEMIERGLVREIGKGVSSGGKPPQLLEFIDDAYTIIGVDIGTTNIVSIAMDMRGQIRERVVEPTLITEGSEAVIGRVIATVERTIAASTGAGQKLMGIGVGIPGLLDPGGNTILFSPDFMWEGVDLKTPIWQHFGMRPYINNVTRAMAMGEKWFGIGHGMDNFMIVNLGYGIGSAMVIDGRIYQGASGSSGEFGHMTVEKSGPLCDCGNYGCLEAVASANAIVKKARNYLARGMQSALNDVSVQQLTAKDVFDAAKAGDALSLQITGEAIDWIGISLANMVNVLDPEMIILGGGMSNAGDFLLDGVRSSMRRHQMKYAGARVRVVQSALGGDAAAVGAAAFLLQKLMETGGDASCV